jgi:hypothetical protein
MESEHENTIIGSVSKNASNIHKKIWIRKLDDQNRPYKIKLIDKNYRDHGKSCPRMENHTNDTTHFLCHLHDFPFLGMICCGLYNFCLLACFLWGLFWLSNYQIQIFLSIFIVIINVLLMIKLSCFNSILVKI